MNLFRSTKEVSNKEEENVKNIEKAEEMNDFMIANENSIDKIDTFEKAKDRMVEVTITQFAILQSDIYAKYQNEEISKYEFENLVKGYIKSIEIPKFGKLSNEDVDEIYKKVYSYLFELDVLGPLIDDKEISDINVNGFDNIWIKKAGKRMKSDIKFRSVESYKTFVQQLAMRNQKSLAEVDSIQKFTDTKSSSDFKLRFNISTEVVNSVGYPYMSIRKTPTFKVGLDTLVQRGMLNNDLKEYLINRVKEGHSFIFCGSDSAGKTTLANELFEYVPNDIRIDVIQDNEEIFSLSNEDIMYHKIVEPRGEGKLGYSLYELGKNDLLTDIDMFFIGETKGREAENLTIMTYSGHICWTTLHTESAKTAHYTIADYARGAQDFNEKSFLSKIGSLDTVVHLKKYKVDEVVEVHGYDRKTGEFRYVDIDVKTGKEKENN